jgi:hypothetical protein
MISISDSEKIMFRAVRSYQPEFGIRKDIIHYESVVYCP